MVKTILSLILIMAGVAWFVLAAGAVGMASRQTTWSENAVPLLGLVPVAIGVAVLIWG